MKPIVSNRFTFITLHALLFTLYAPRAEALQVTAQTLSNFTISAETVGVSTTTTVQFSIDGPADVTVQIQENSSTQTVATLSQNFPSLGAKQIFWDALWPLGGDSGRKDGTFTFQIFASSGSNFSSATIGQALQITSIDIHNVSVAPSVDASGTPTFPYLITYALAKDSNASAKVVNSSGTLVRTLLTNKLQFGETVSTHTLTWDGLANDGKSAPIGIYTVVLDATDPVSGDQAFTRTRSIAVLSLAGSAADPEKLFADNVFVFPNPVRNGQGTFQMEAIRDGANLSLKIYTITGTLVFDQSFPGIPAGNLVTFPWTATNQSGSKVGRGLYYYVVREDDSVGTLQTVKKMVVLP